MRDCQPVQIESFLSRAPLFEGLSPEDLATMAKGTHELKLAKGETLFRQGDHCTGFYVLVYGQIKLAISSPQGTEKVVEIIQPGHSFGEAIMLLDKSYFIYAEALVDTLVLHVAKETIYAELQKDYSFGRKMLAGMAMRTHQLMTDVEAYSLHSGTQRVIGYFMHELLESQHGEEQVARLERVALEITECKTPRPQEDRAKETAPEHRGHRVDARLMGEGANGSADGKGDRKLHRRMSDLGCVGHEMSPMTPVGRTKGAA